MSVRAVGLCVGLVLMAGLAGCSGNDHHASPTTTTTATPQVHLGFSSPAFPDQGGIPRQYTCDGANQSPPLAWTGVPPSAAELALFVEDPDAPQGTFVHWVLSGIPPTTTSLAAGSTGVGTDGTNSVGKKAYGGPCPPKGTQHRYIFTLLAFPAPTHLTPAASAGDVRRAGSAIGVGRLVGLYGR